MPVVTMKDRGDLRIPVEVRRKIGLRDGDRLLVEIRAGELILTPLPPHVPLDALRGKYADKVQQFGPLTKDSTADAVVADVLARREAGHER